MKESKAQGFAEVIAKEYIGMNVEHLVVDEDDGTKSFDLKSVEMIFQVYNAAYDYAFQNLTD